MNLSSIIWLRRLTKATVFFTLFLIFVGALVKSHEVGLSVPDWPTTYGKQMFAFPLSDMVGGIFYEHGHRMMATFVGFITLVQTICLGFSNQQRWVKKTAYASLLLVIIQGIFGGITVLFFLPPVISIIHGVLAQTFFVLTILIAYGISNERSRRIEDNESLEVKKYSLIILVMVYIQLILGALMRHTASGLAIPDFPTMGGAWIPTFSDTMINNINVILFDMDIDMVNRYQVIIHFTHRLGALIISGTIGYFLYRHGYLIKKNQIVMKTVRWIIILLLAQLTLGVFTILSEKSPYIASFHVVVGAAFLGLCTLIVLRSHPIRWIDWKS